jgi:hypothetical protein
MKNKKIFYFIFILLFTFLLICSLSQCSYGAEPKLVKTITKAFENIKDWLIKLATPAAAVAVATGVFMKKFSFGDEEKIRVGKKLIKSSLFSYAFILAIDLILSAIQSLIS